MSRSNRLAWLRNLLLLLAGAGGIVLSALWLQHIARIDPFAGMRRNDQPQNRQVAVVLEDVQMLRFKGKKLEAKAKIGRIEILDNRQELTFFAVTDGVFHAQKSNFNFDTDQVEWNAVQQVVQFKGNAHVKNKDVDLKAANFRFNTKKELLDIPGEIGGKFFDGKLVANGLVYNMAEESYKTGPASWEGMLDSPLQEGTTKTRWKIEFDGITKTKDGIQSGENARATDGEIIVKADKLSRDVKTDVITATGNVRYFSAKSNLRAEKVVVDRKAKHAILTGAVDMLLKPEDKQTLDEVEIPPFRPMVPDAVSKERPPAPVQGEDDEVSSTKSIRKYPVVVTAAKVEYWYGKGNRHAIITGDPQAQQELLNGRWRRAWTYKALYDGEKELLKLVSSAAGKREARMKNSRGEDLMAEWFEISTKEDDDAWTSKNLIGEMYSDEDEDEAANRKRFSRPGNLPPPPLRGPIGGRL